MSASPSDARASIVAAIKAANITNLPNDHVYGYEPNPATGVLQPRSVTVNSAGFTATEWLINIRVYVSLLAVDSKLAESELERVALAVDASLPAAAIEPNWNFGRASNLEDCLIAYTTLPMPREDYF